MHGGPAGSARWCPGNGGRYSHSYPTSESEVANSITVITADGIAARQEQTLPDVLKDVPGLNLVQTGGPGGQTSVFMRGTNSNHVKVFVDGRSTR